MARKERRKTAINRSVCLMYLDVCCMSVCLYVHACWALDNYGVVWYGTLLGAEIRMVMAMLIVMLGLRYLCWVHVMYFYCNWTCVI